VNHIVWRTATPPGASISCAISRHSSPPDMTRRTVTDSGLIGSLRKLRITPLT
jgi:hypothetical protein